MSNPTGPTPSYTSPDVLKHMEKDLVKAGKTEESSVKHTMKDLKSLEKSTTKAAKVSQITMMFASRAWNLTHAMFVSCSRLTRQSIMWRRTRTKS